MIPSLGGGGRAVGMVLLQVGGRCWSPRVSKRAPPPSHPAPAAGPQRPAPAPACQRVPGGAAARLAGAGVQGGALLVRGGPRDLPQRGEDGELRRAGLGGRLWARGARASSRCDPCTSSPLVQKLSLLCPRPPEEGPPSPEAIQALRWEAIGDPRQGRLQDAPVRMAEQASPPVQEQRDAR